MKTWLLHNAFTIHLLRKHFSFMEAIKVLRVLKKEGEIIKLSKQSDIFLRKGTKDHETFKEIFIDNIYNIPLHIYPKTIIDAGGNIGLASRFFKHKYPESQVILIEVDQENSKEAEKNLKSYSGLTILNKGLYNTNTYFKINDTFNATNSYVVEEATQDDYDIESITIPDIIHEYNWQVVDLLKIDIEGAEKALFSSDYEEWLPKVNVIMIETHDRMVAQCSITVMKALDRYDFGLYTTTEGGTMIYYSKSLIEKINLRG